MSRKKSSRRIIAKIRTQCTTPEFPLRIEHSRRRRGLPRLGRNQPAESKTTSSEGKEKNTIQGQEMLREIRPERGAINRVVKGGTKSILM